MPPGKIHGKLISMHFIFHVFFSVLQAHLSRFSHFTLMTRQAARQAVLMLQICIECTISSGQKLTANKPTRSVRWCSSRPAVSVLIAGGNPSKSGSVKLKFCCTKKGKKWKMNPSHQRQAELVSDTMGQSGTVCGCSGQWIRSIQNFEFFCMDNILEKKGVWNGQNWG